ncbi:hypothetical protein [Lysinibacillus sp. RS5]|uniref:hypothetical protein n=1 Tax=unclassified Lysinibacillus TaxID=2636778 RepID=UPI0035BE4AAF
MNIKEAHFYVENGTPMVYLDYMESTERGTVGKTLRIPISLIGPNANHEINTFLKSLLEQHENKENTKDVQV